MTSRPRASTPRSRLGCSTCRQRRIKCDEQRPSCQQCVRSGWRCPGYASPGGHSVPEQNSISVYNLPYKIPGSQDERRALHYFSVFGASELDGYFPSDFWTHTVLQRCEHHVAIRHAAAALGRAHIEYINAEDTSTFSATQATQELHGKAIKTLRRSLEGSGAVDRSVVLICSTIFYSYELVRGERDAALKHLQSGLKILKDWQRESQRESASSQDRTAIPEPLIQVLTAMDFQATIFNDVREPVLQVGERNGPGHSAEEPARVSFDSESDAMQSLFPILHRTLSFLVRHVQHKLADLGMVPVETIRERRILIDEFQRWESKLLVFEQAREGPQESVSAPSGEAGTLSTQRKALAVAKLHFLAVRLLLLHSLRDSVSHNSLSFDDEAEKMLELGRQAIVPDTDKPNSFTLHMGIVAPIFLLAMKVTEDRTRRAAIDLLHAAKGRREGLYDAHEMAQAVATLSQQVNAHYEDQVHIDDSSNTPALEWAYDEIIGPHEKINDPAQHSMERVLISIDTTRFHSYHDFVDQMLVG